MTTLSRSRLLAGTAFAVAGTFGLAAPAQAQCVVTANSVTCATTATTNTTNPGAPTTTATDRNYPANTSAGGYTATVSTGAAITGAGFAVTNTVGGTNPLTVVINGSVTSSGAPTTAGGTSAVNVNATGATPVVYSGTGAITNNTGAGNGLEFVMPGTGSLTANVGGNVTSGLGLGDLDGNGILINSTGTTGALSLTTATGTTVLADFAGIYGFVQNPANDSSLTIVSNSIIGSRAGAALNVGVYGRTQGTGAVSITSNGAIGTATDRPLGTGVLGRIFNPASTATLTINTGAGAIFAGNFGVSGEHLGVGTLNITTGTGAIDATGIAGINASATTGAINITTGGSITGPVGILATSSGGAPAAQTIIIGGPSTGTGATVTGTTSGVLSSSAGARSITVNANTTLTGGTQAIELTGGGAATITNAGTIGTAATGLAINAGTGASSVAITNTGRINGRVLLTAGADSYTGSGRWDTAGVNDFGAGTDTLTISANGTFNVANGTSFVGLETFTNAGTTNFLGNGGTVTFSNTAVTNNGTINVPWNNTVSPAVLGTGGYTLNGITTFTNGTAGALNLGSGTLTFGAATTAFTNNGTVRAEQGASSLVLPAGVAFANNGTIDLQDGDTADVFTIPGNYTAGTGARLLLDISNTAADRLVIGGTTTGTTNIVLTSTANQFDTTGILVVDAAGTPAAGAFTTTSQTFNGLIQYSIVQRGNDYFAVALPTARALQPVVYANLAQDSWYQGAEAVNAMAAGLGGEANSGVGVWIQPYYSKDRYGDRTETATVFGTPVTYDARIKTDRYGIQGGVDFGVGMGVVGITGGWQRAEIDAGLTDLDGWNIGAYGLFGGTSGVYGNVLAKYDSNNIDLANGAFNGSGLDTDSTSFGVDGEVGFRGGASSAMTFDVHAGLAYVRSKIDDFTFGGITYDYDGINSFRGRLGARLVFNELAKLFVGGKLFHEFNGDSRLTFDSLSDSSFETPGRGTWGRLELGFGGGVDTPFMASAWGDFGDVKGWGVRAGVRFGGRREAMPEPVPAAAPAPAPAPATQTCPDGSVILATDQCPPPPAPPAPAPQPGERG